MNNVPKYLYMYIHIEIDGYFLKTKSNVSLVFGVLFELIFIFVITDSLPTHVDHGYKV